MDVINILVPYAVGTIAGVWLCYRYLYESIQERLIVKTIDRLVAEDYCRSYVNNQGEVELYKWYELDDVFDEIKRQQENEEDDAP